MTSQSAPTHSDDFLEPGIRPLRGGVALRSGDWADSGDDGASRRARRWAIVWEVLLVLAITAIGAGLRFMWLDRPAIWGDEAMTYNRVCSTYADLVNDLRGVGFVPLHYELYWWLRTWLLEHGRVFTPALMRLPVAICSTLTIPAMYLLARQLVGRRAAIVTGLIAATSAYMLFYAHDAKMYADSWLFCALEMAAFVWWLRSGRVMAWLAWIATGAIAVGISGPALALLGVQPIFLIGQRHHRWWKTLAFLVGAAVIAAGPAYYYESFTKWGEHIQDDGWGASGLQWVDRYNQNRNGLDLVQFTSTAYLFAWEWPTIDTVDDIEPDVLKKCEWASEAVLALLALGVFPWPTRRRYRQLIPPLSPQTPSEESRWGIVAGFRRMLDAPSPVAWWRSAIWISAWIIVPAYGMYLVSVSAAESPIDWMHEASQWLADPYNAAMAALVAIPAFYCCAVSFAGRVVRTLQLIGVLLVPLLICLGLRELLKVDSPGSLWMPRYLGFIWPAVAIAGAVLLLRLPSAPLRWGAIGLVVAMNVVNGVERMTQYTEPPMGAIMKDLFDAAESDGRVLTVCDFIRGGPSPGVQAADGAPARYYTIIYAKDQIVVGQFWSWNFEPRIGPGSYPQDADPSSVADALSNDPDANRLIVWHVHRDKADPIDYSTSLRKPWRLASTQQYHLFQYWNWNQLNWLDREEWVRQ